MLPRFHALIRQILACDVPTLAKVSGLCLGGGFEISLACGLLFCSTESELGVPEMSLGVFPPAASVLLPCKLGDSSTCEIILTGRRYTAEELFRRGAVNGISEARLFDAAVGEFIEKHILPKSASSLRIACRASRAAIRRSFDAHIAAAEHLYLEALMSTKDAVEGIEAFLEKRTPRWTDE